MIATRIFAIAACAALCACMQPSDPKAQGKALYDACINCHGADGLGMPSLGAPQIAGLSKGYLQQQLHNFRDGVRGYHPDDAAGLRMRPMSRAIRDEKDLALVIDYVASLPAGPNQTMLTATDTSHGQQLFATCAACHGPDGGGNPALHAPNIAGQADWYVAAQLTKFKAGLRGAHPKDTWGLTMAGIAKTLPDQKAIHDVASYVAALPRKAAPQ